MFTTDWDKWYNVHTLEGQAERRERACQSKLSPLDFNADEQIATFRGSGNSHYESTLTTCTCMDFRRRKLPCKHMYRLAYELKLIELDNSVLKSDTAPMSKKEALDLVYATFSDEKDLRFFAYFCYRCGNNNSGEQMVEAVLAKKLLASGLAVEVTDISKRLSYVNMQELRKFLPAGTKSPRTKKELVELLSPLVELSDITYPDDQKCLTLGPAVSHLGHSLHRNLCALLPD